MLCASRGGDDFGAVPDTVLCHAKTKFATAKQMPFDICLSRHQHLTPAAVTLVLAAGDELRVRRAEARLRRHVAASHIQAAVRGWRVRHAMAAAKQARCRCRYAKALNCMTLSQET